MVALLSAGLAAGAPAAAAEPLVPVYVGVDENAPPDQVAVLLVNSEAPDTGALQCYVRWVRTVMPGDSHPKPLMGTTLLVVKPGRFAATAPYKGVRAGLTQGESKIEAGKRYRVNCVGRTHHTLAITWEPF